ncbi:LysE family translocator [Neisseriaceae bacterium CLB008]|nr:LysE family translocator [Neisseriaceae bacterium]
MSALASAFIGLLLTAGLLIAIPGPSVLYIVGQALAFGRRSALYGVLGNTVGSASTGLLVVLGLGYVFTLVPWLQTVTVIVGALVLLWIGGQYMHQAWRPGAISAAVVEANPGHSFRMGLVVGASNPKVLIMFGTIVPSFMPRTDSVGLSAQTLILLLALVPIVTGLVVDTAWAMLAVAGRRFMQGAESRLRLMHCLGGLLMLMMALWLLVDVAIGIV